MYSAKQERETRHSRFGVYYSSLKSISNQRCNQNSCDTKRQLRKRIFYLISVLSNQTGEQRCRGCCKSTSRVVFSSCSQMGCSFGPACFQPNISLPSNPFTCRHCYPCARLHCVHCALLDSRPHRCCPCNKSLWNSQQHSTAPPVASDPAISVYCKKKTENCWSLFPHRVLRRVG